ncbi:CubicO group peptidase (beta-lactamase class C family) [Streptosporangium album]|uniref:CubicO group peptidase (Beta-lactamase class C family) n=1 Tax=Streptosporangium album TaxID=47479 RepID=A0A7W7S2E3_9ACTN|nr:serine hydrolase domain-containing protein [Streptosporangium album]MBB4942262.1 CubicO group peptidase (beta-lactamase class C family) [Streptosporangium album]
MTIGGTSLTRRRFLQAGAGAVPALALDPGLARAATTPATTGVVPASLAGFDSMMKKYVTERQIDCAQLAVARKGKILLARGYGGYSIRDAQNQPVYRLVQPTSLLRVASLSKHITSAAIMRLVQDGKLSLSTPVTTLLGLSTQADPRLAKVTVLRLMQHLGGWDRDASKDPLWLDHTISTVLDVPLPISHANIMRYTTDRPLDFDPGSKMVYSNYGYMLLGRIIEKVSGTTYESYIKQKLLAPAGITRMRLGRSLRAESPASEVNYTSKYTNKSVVDDSGTVVPYPYGGFSMPNQDANGGWTASAVDLVKFAMVFDAAGPILNATSIAKLFAKPEIGVNGNGSWYGGGWWVRTSGSGINTWHNGSMPGTFSFLARLSNGVSYCAVFNRREEEGSPDFDSIDPLLGQAAGAVTSWPTTDLTSRYF